MESSKLSLQIPKPIKLDSHIQHHKRFQKATDSKNLVSFTIAGERSVMPSSNPNEKPYSIKFVEPYNCECMSFIQGCARDPNFACYHVIASILRWNEVSSAKVCMVPEVEKQ